MLVFISDQQAAELEHYSNLSGIPIEQLVNEACSDFTLVAQDRAKPTVQECKADLSKWVPMFKARLVQINAV